MATAVVAISVAALLVGYTGFGFNLLAVPLLAIVMGSKEAVIVALIVGTIVNTALALSSRFDNLRKLLYHLLQGAVPGLAIGVLLFAAFEDGPLRLLIGSLTLVFAVYLYDRPLPVQMEFARGHVVGVGAASGVLTGTTGMGGPPKIALLIHSTQVAKEIRGTTAAFTAVMSLLALVALWFTGVMASDLASVQDTVTMSLRLGPVGLAGMTVGAWMFRLNSAMYARVVAMTLLVLGVSGVTLAYSALVH